MHGEARIRRIAAERLGRRAELLAALHYRARGYRILSRRYRAHGGEIDLIAARPGLVVFVEVKARADFNAAIEAVTPRLRRRFERAAGAFLASHPAHGADAVRFDIAAVSGMRCRLVRDAWRTESGTP